MWPVLTKLFSEALQKILDIIKRHYGYFKIDTI